MHTGRTASTSGQCVAQSSVELCPKVSQNSGCGELNLRQDEGAETLPHQTSHSVAVSDYLEPRAPTLGLIIRFGNDRSPQQRGATGPGIIGLALRVEAARNGVDIVGVEDPGTDQVL